MTKSKKLLTLCFSCDDKNFVNALLQSQSVLNEFDSVEVVIVIQDLYHTLDRNLINSIREENINIHVQKGKGLSRSRNLAISDLKTKYSWVLDGDIEFDLCEFKHLLIFLENNNASIIGVSTKAIENSSYFRKYKRDIGANVIPPF